MIVPQGQAARDIFAKRPKVSTYALPDRLQGFEPGSALSGMNTDKFQQFTTMLDAPPSHNPGLERLMAVAAPWATVKA